MEEKHLEGLKLLRADFPEHQISKLPKGTKAQNECEAKDKVNCAICGGWHHPKIKHLDYVGHAALTDRLLDADPLWTWEPLAYREGLPAFDLSGGLWIKLTVCGVTRLGYGNAAGKQHMDVGAREKEVIGDALRNAGMRFGAALDLWHKGDLHKDEPPDEPKTATKITPEPVDQKKVFEATVWFKEMIDADQLEVNALKVQRAWERLSNNERMEVDGKLKDKAPGSNKMYSRILKEYLAYVPSVPAALGNVGTEHWQE